MESKGSNPDVGHSGGTAGIFIAAVRGASDREFRTARSGSFDMLSRLTTA